MVLDTGGVADVFRLLQPEANSPGGRCGNQSRVCRPLLADANLALEVGYRGTPFQLTGSERETVRRSRDFAGRLYNPVNHLACEQRVIGKKNFRTLKEMAVAC
jgi:hypothetical protein